MGGKHRRPVRLHAGKQDAVLNAFHSLERDTLEKEVFKLLSLTPLSFSAQEGFNQLSEADQDFIVSVYGLGITGLFLRWIGANMMSPPEPMIRQLYRLMGGSLQGIVQRFLTTADTE
ncbi:MAG: TetR-like C-terminal domain-containing protein [Christensenellales bacterium]